MKFLKVLGLSIVVVLMNATVALAQTPSIFTATYATGFIDLDPAPQHLQNLRYWPMSMSRWFGGCRALTAAKPA